MPRRAEDSVRRTSVHPCVTVGPREAGVTLVELLVALAIGSAIALAVAIGMHQVLTGTYQTNDHNTVINQVRNAEHWISRDARMAKPGNVTVNTDPGDSTFIQIVVWLDADGTTTSTFTYTLDDGTLLRDRDGQQTFVAEHISDKEEDVTWCTWDNDTQTLTVTITAELVSVSETRTFEVRARPDPVEEEET